MKAKVFGIGFHKTATTSLAKALTHLGYRVTGPNGVDNPNIADEVYDIAFRLVNEFDAFQDNPWPLLYKELDQHWPGSKFVLTIRPTERWINSIVDHFGKNETPMREWIYGVGYPQGNEHVYVARYERHNREVADYFKQRRGDLLTLRITEGEGWEKLCPFLGKEIPAVPFPFANSLSERRKSHKRENNYFRRTWNKIDRRARKLIAG